jgi:hypothetical protein
MPELRHGYDYHLAEVRRITERRSQTHLWEAYCNACGWVGRERSTKSAAEDDAAAHDITENPA